MLSWWKKKVSWLPGLSKTVKDVLAVQSSVMCKSVSSTSRIVVCGEKTRLGGDRIEALMCGYKVNDKSAKQSERSVPVQRP